MKRITKLEISNFRAFFDNYLIALSNGENSLIYGENGSGKSLLFKSNMPYTYFGILRIFIMMQNHLKNKLFEVISGKGQVRFGLKLIHGYGELQQFPNRGLPI